MEEYISKKDALNICQESIDFSAQIDNPSAGAEAYRIRNLIRQLPSADVVERKQGKWKQIELEQRCSICGFRHWTDCEYRYCPNCGAEMS